MQNFAQNHKTLNINTLEWRLLSLSIQKLCLYLIIAQKPENQPCNPSASGKNDFPLNKQGLFFVVITVFTNFFAKI
jgi:hypothetical protein